MNNKALVLY